MKNFKYLMDHVLLQIFKIILTITSKIMKPLLIILQCKFISTKLMIKLLLKSNQDIILLELLTTETMTLLESKEKKIETDENSENVSQLEITKVGLVHCSIIKNTYQYDSKVLHKLIINGLFGHFLEISSQIIFLRRLIYSFIILRSALLIKVINQPRYKTELT